MQREKWRQGNSAAMWLSAGLICVIDGFACRFPFLGVSPMDAQTTTASFLAALNTLDRLLQEPVWGESLFFLSDGYPNFPQFLDRFFAFADNQSKTAFHVDCGTGRIVRHGSGTPNSTGNLTNFRSLEATSQFLCALLDDAGQNSYFCFDEITQLLELDPDKSHFRVFLVGLCRKLRECWHTAYFRLRVQAIENPELRLIVETLPSSLNSWRPTSRLHLQSIGDAVRYGKDAPLHSEPLEPTSAYSPKGDGDRLRQLLKKNVREFQQLYAEKRDLERTLQKKNFELSLINELTATLLSATKLDQILHRILVGVTANEGLGFNRAFLLVINNKNRVLEGKMAIGPSSLEEALRIWGELSRGKFTFADIVTANDGDWPRHDIHVTQIVKKIRIGLDDRAHLLVQLLYRPKPEIVCGDLSNCPHAEEILRLFEVQSFAAVPLLYRKLPLGLLLADNAITQKPIAPEKLPMLETFANYAAAAIEHARLYEEIRLRMTENERHLRELEAMQDRLVRSKRLSDLGELASKMAHEVRTPLVSIGGFANAMLKNCPPGSSDQDYLTIIVQEVRRLERIISDVMAYVNPGIPHMRLTNIQTILDQAVFLMNVSLQQAHIRVKTDYAEQLPTVSVDPDQMKQVFLALINNALESMAEGGTLTISATARGDFLRICFADTGEGIEKDKLDKVFEAFFTTKSRGSGLGLNIASQIISNHKGSIYADGEPGRGATFYINLPLVVH